MGYCVDPLEGLDTWTIGNAGVIVRAMLINGIVMARCSSSERARAQA